MFEVNVKNVMEEENRGTKRKRNTARVWGSDCPGITGLRQAIADY